MALRRRLTSHVDPQCEGSKEQDRSTLVVDHVDPPEDDAIQSEPIIGKQDFKCCSDLLADLFEVLDRVKREYLQAVQLDDEAASSSGTLLESGGPGLPP